MPPRGLMHTGSHGRRNDSPKSQDCLPGSSLMRCGRRCMACSEQNPVPDRFTDGDPCGIRCFLRDERYNRFIALQTNSRWEEEHGYDNYLSYSTMIHIVILPLIVSEKVYKNRKAPAEMMPGRSFLDVLAVSGVCVLTVLIHSLNWHARRSDPAALPGRPDITAARTAPGSRPRETPGRW